MEKVSFGKLEIEITRRCNLKCKHCMRGEAQNIDMSYDIINNILDQTCAIEKLHITGGEPFIAKDKIIYFYEQIMKRNIIVLETQIITNGMMIDEDIADVFKRFNRYLKEWYEAISNEKFSEDFIKKHIQILISSDRYHDNDSNYLFDKIDALMGDFCVVTLYNRGNQIKNIGRAKKLPCGSLVANNELRRVAIFGKGYPCYCKTISDELRNNQPDYYTIMCPVQITAKGIMLQLMECDFEEEDNKKYAIVDFSKNEDIISGIERYNKNKKWCAYININERDNDWFDEHGTVDWNLRNINFMSEKYKNDKEEENNPKYKDFTLDTEEYLKLYNETTREEKIQKILEYTPKEDEEIIGEIEYGKYKDIFMRYKGLTKVECMKIHFLESNGGFSNPDNKKELTYIISENFKRIIRKEVEKNIHSIFSQENRRKAYLILLNEKCHNNMDELYNLYLESFVNSVDFGEYSDLRENITTRDIFEDYINHELNEWEAIKIYFSTEILTIIHSITFENYNFNVEWGYYDEIIRRLSIIEVYKEYYNNDEYKDFRRSDWNGVSYEIVESVLNTIENFYREIFKYDCGLMYLENERCKQLNKPTLYSDDFIMMELIKHPIQFMKFTSLINEAERKFPKKNEK